MAQVCSESGTALHYVTAWQMSRAVEAVRQLRNPAAVVRETGRLAPAKEDCQ
jgi:hypothetical protein